MFTGNILFTVFRIFGIWRPTFFAKKNWQIIFSKIYSIFNFTVYFYFVFSFIPYLMQVINNVDEFTKTLFYFSATFAIYIKIISFAIKKKTVIELDEMLSEKICQPRDIYEFEILHQVSRTCKINTIIYQLMINSSLIILFITSIEKNGQFSLMISSWFPYNINSSKLVFFSTYLYQSFALIITAWTTIASECFAMIIILRIGGQLDIIIHRLNSLSIGNYENYPECVKYYFESKIIRDCVEHHIYIFAIGEKLNDLFGFVIFIQFFASMMDLCLIIFQLSRMNTDALMFLIHLGSIMFQTFVYNLYGEKLIEKSLAISHEIWNIDWPNLAKKTKYDLSMIAMRASRPIQLSGSSAIIMSINTFVKVIKSAYTSYNLLSNVS
ncbi:odorant receptor 67c-like [Leptopilina boulardi]|uniref:odorant receptor 67c-like n=1 Tax=Leptopilina boulardi TaxID=63433 RepID=UPI0021F53884|nr:odorant receptor 67c-like [Leptopilina boulardi]